MYTANKDRYSKMPYNRVGTSGLKLPAISLGLWQNFGSGVAMDTVTKLLTTAFDNGITHFDLANNYGPIPGSAEENFGNVMAKELKPYRDELIISTKAGYGMWDGPYGDGGSKKYLVSSLDQSLKRMGLEYVDIFYHHRFDANADLYEIAHTLDLVVKQGKALYVGVSNYDAKQTETLKKILQTTNTPFIINQPCYSMIKRHTEDDGLYSKLSDLGMGSIAFCPLAQGLLTDKYLKGLPQEGRALRVEYLKNTVTKEFVELIGKLNTIAKNRSQSLAQLALCYVLKNATSVLIGVRTMEQLQENIGAIDNIGLSDKEYKTIVDLLNLYDIK